MNKKIIITLLASGMAISSLALEIPMSEYPTIIEVNKIVPVTPRLTYFVSDIRLKSLQNIKIPAIVEDDLDTALNEINDLFQGKKTNLRFTHKVKIENANKRFNFGGGNTQLLLKYFESNNIFLIQKKDEIILSNKGVKQYRIADFHSTKELSSLKNKLTRQARVKQIKENDFYGDLYYSLIASVKGHLIADKIIKDDIKAQLEKQRIRIIKLKKSNGTTLAVGIKLDKPMTVKGFFRTLGSLDEKNYIVAGNANIPMSENIFIKNHYELSRYLKKITGKVILSKKDGDFIYITIKKEK